MRFSPSRDLKEAVQAALDSLQPRRIVLPDALRLQLEESNLDAQLLRNDVIPLCVDKNCGCSGTT